MQGSNWPHASVLAGLTVSGRTFAEQALQASWSPVIVEKGEHHLVPGCAGQHRTAARAASPLVAAMAGSSSRLVGAPRRVKSRNAIPDERLKLLVAHVAEFIYMGALDLLHIEPHEFAALHFCSDGGAAYG